MNTITKSLITFLGLAAFTAHASPMTLAKFDFDDVPTGIENVADTSAAETVASGFGAATFTVVRNNTSNVNQSAIANVDGSGNMGAAQISGQNNSTYAWAQDPVESNYFEFTVNFGTIDASDVSFGELVLTGRTGVEWSNTGALSTHASSRHSTLTVRSSLDNFAANIGSEVNPSFGNTTNDAWVTTSIDLSALSLVGSEADITFRIYTKTTAASNQFHRTQLNSVELTGVAIPEPGTLALLGIALGTLAVFRRRSR